MNMIKRKEMNRPDPNDDLGLSEEPTYKAVRCYKNDMKIIKSWVNFISKLPLAYLIALPVAVIGALATYILLTIIGNILKL